MRNGCFGKMDHPVHTIPSHPPTKMDILQSLFSNHPCCQMVSAVLKYVPQPTATTFAFSSVFLSLFCSAPPPIPAFSRLSQETAHLRPCSSLLEYQRPGQLFTHLDALKIQCQSFSNVAFYVQNCFAYVETKIDV